MKFDIEKRLQKGISTSEEGSLHKAEEYYRTILNLDPKHPEANHNLGEIVASANKMQEAIGLFKTALMANPKIEKFWFSYIDALTKAKHFDIAIGVLAQGKKTGLTGKKVDLCEAQLISLVEQDKKKSLELKKRTMLPHKTIKSLAKLICSQQYQKAFKYSEDLLDKFSESALLYNVCGAAKAGQGKFRCAIKFFKLALKLDPHNAEIFSNMSLAFKGLGKLENAVACCEKALQINPNYADAYSNLGAIFSDKKDFTLAIANYAKAIEINPEVAVTYYNMGTALHDSGKPKSAIENYVKSIKIDSSFADAYHGMGISFAKLGNLKEAIKNSEKAIEFKPDFSDAHNRLGISLAENGNLESALESFKRAVHIKPDFTDAIWNLSGMVTRISEAIYWLEKSLETNREHLLSILYLSALKAYNGDSTEFRALQNTSLRDNPMMRSFSWALGLEERPEIFFNRWKLFDRVTELGKSNRPFYEFGVFRGVAFKYFIDSFGEGFGFDTFQGIPEDWHHEKAGKYSSEGNIPEIEGGRFIVGKFEDTLPEFFSEARPLASVVNFDADLYSSTICALNFSKPIIDEHTILIFDEFLMNNHWEQDEYKALNEFCVVNGFSYKVIAISFHSKQVVVKLQGT